MTLRGASVEVDARKAARIVVVVVMTALAALGLTILIAGIQKNAQISSLREHGIPVSVTVTKCSGQLGGSGSNAAAYSCVGTFRLGAQQHVVAIPGETFRPAGSSVTLVTTRDDPRLIATTIQVASERPSMKFLIFPVADFVILLSAGTVVLYRRRIR